MQNGVDGVTTRDGPERRDQTKNTRPTTTNAAMPYAQLTWTLGYFIRRESAILFIENGRVHHDKRDPEISTVNQPAIPFSQDNPTPRATSCS